MISHKVLSFFFLLFTSDVNYFSGCCAKSQMPRTEKGKSPTTFSLPTRKNLELEEATLFTSHAEPWHSPAANGFSDLWK